MAVDKNKNLWQEPNVSFLRDSHKRRSMSTILAAARDAMPVAGRQAAARFRRLPRPAIIRHDGRR